MRKHYLQKAKTHKDGDKKKRDHESSDDSKEEHQSKSESTPVRKQLIDFDYPKGLMIMSILLHLS